MDPGVPHEHVLAGHLDVVEQQVAVVERVQTQLRPDLAHSDAWRAAEGGATGQVTCMSVPKCLAVDDVPEVKTRRTFSTTVSAITVSGPPTIR